MKINKLPNNLQLLARKRREEESNTLLFDSEDILENAFEWGRTKEGHNFWDEVNTGKFDPYRELYPKDEWVDDYPGEYQVVADAYGNTIVAKVGDYVQPPFDSAYDKGVELHDGVDSLIITPTVLANGYYAGEGVSQEIKDAWKHGYEYANRVSGLGFNTTHVGNSSVITNEGIKESCGKIDYSEINFEILDLMAARFEANKHKYPKGNMLKPIEISKLLWPVFRHWKKMMFPLDDDTETFEDHLAAIMCNCSMILDQLKLNK